MIGLILQKIAVCLSLFDEERYKYLAILNIIAFDVGERNPNLGLRVVNMGSLCFYMRAESRFFGGFVGVCTKSAPF